MPKLVWLFSHYIRASLSNLNCGLETPSWFRRGVTASTVFTCKIHSNDSYPLNLTEQFGCNTLKPVQTVRKIMGLAMMLLANQDLVTCISLRQKLEAFVYARSAHKCSQVILGCACICTGCTQLIILLNQNPNKIPNIICDLTLKKSEYNLKKNKIWN